MTTTQAIPGSVSCHFEAVAYTAMADWNRLTKLRPCWALYSLGKWHPKLTNYCEETHSPDKSVLARACGDSDFPFQQHLRKASSDRAVGRLILRRGVA